MLASLVLVSLGALAALSPTTQPLVAEAPVQQPSAIPTPEQTPWPPKGVIRPGPGIVSPKLIKHPHPSYTAEAMRAGIQGEVFMEAVVLADGTVGEVRITRPLDPGLDDQAVRTLKLWQFEAGRRGGVAVPVVVEIQMTFSVRGSTSVRMAAVVPPASKPVFYLDPIALSKVEVPRLVFETKPNYTAAAMRAGIEGVVGLEALVGVDGRVSEARVTQSLDQEHGLNEEAVRTLRQWRFVPGHRAGVAVPVVVQVQISFALRK